jgi:tRNA threonylcarbamoyladenosine biosynthesis protein TsaB
VNNLNLIAIDASTEACSAALSWQGEILTRFEMSPQSHSLLLLPQVDALLAEAGIKLQQLDGLVFGQGPGSFTGVRIGIGVAQGLAFAADLPVVGISTLQALAQQAYRIYQAEQVVSAIDARMGEIYSGQFTKQNQLMQPVTTEQVMSPEQLSAQLVFQPQQFVPVGTGWHAYKEVLANLTDLSQSSEHQAMVLFPDAQDMLTLARPKFLNNETCEAENAQPIYLRDTVSWKKLPGRE